MMGATSRKAGDVPKTLVGRAIAAIYVLGVVASTLIWVTQGAYSAAVAVTSALTLPFSPLAYVSLYFAGMALVGSSSVVEAAIFTPLLLVLFPGIAVGNVFMARALWGAHLRRRPRRESASARRRSVR